LGGLQRRLLLDGWIGNVFDFRPLTHEVATAVLAVFSLRTALEKGV
jgi:hypothetical protein